MLNFYFYDSVSFHPSFYPSSSSPQRAFNLSPSLVSLVIQIKFFEFPFVSSVILSGWTFFPLVHSLKITFFSSSSSSRRRRRLVVVTYQVIKDTHHVVSTKDRFYVIRSLSAQRLYLKCLFFYIYHKDNTSKRFKRI